MPLTDAPNDSLNMTCALTLLDQIGELVTGLNGAPLNIDGDNNKDRMRANAKRSKDLLYAAHLADLARAEILSQYHRFKGQSPPPISV